MEEGKRQKQVAGLIQQELNDVFRHLGLNMMHGGMVSIANVKVTPDLLECRIYLSFFKIEDKATKIAEGFIQSYINTDGGILYNQRGSTDVYLAIPFL